MQNKTDLKEWLETKIENRIEIEMGKQQVAAIRNNCIVGHESKNKTQNSDESLAFIKFLYFL